MTLERPSCPRISVVIPTYRRPDALINCIRSIRKGTVLPDEVILVAREDDAATWRVLEPLSTKRENPFTIRLASVTQPGHVPPVETGVNLATGQLVAIVDDDVTVTPGWLEAIIDPFADPVVGVVGGPVVIPGQPPGKPKGKPGRVTWYGKTWGNLANLGGKCAMELDTVMEGNWAWRRDLLRRIRKDPVLNFDDASMYGLDLCLQAKAAGFRVLFEPRALVLHHCKPRAPELDRADRPARLFSYCRNYTYIMLRRLPAWRKLVFVVWWFGIGERAAAGIGALFADALTGRKHQPAEVRRVFAGKIEGVRLWLRGRKAFSSQPEPR